MSNKNEIKPGMFVLWRMRGSTTLPKERFLGLVVEEIKEKERFGLRRASRQFLVFVRTLYEHTPHKTKRLFLSMSMNSPLT
jgi:hypothetical protein